MWLTKHGDTTSGAKLRRGQVSGAGQGMTIQGESEYRSPELLFPGGAEILLKNTGEVVINGQSFPAKSS